MKLPFNIDIVSLPIILFKNRGRHLTINTHPVIYGIYKITSPKGAIYIGLSNDIYYRFHSCYKLLSCKQQKKIYNSLKKHGVENHTFEIIHVVEKVKTTESKILKELKKLEIYYIKEFNSFSGDNPKFGLNLTRGGDGMQLTDEAWERINKSKIGRKQSPETVAKRVTKLKGRKPSPQTIAASVLSNTGRIRSPETRQKLREANLGKKASPETLKKKSDSMKGKGKGRKNSEESKRKQSETLKAMGLTAWNKGLSPSDETRKKQSESHKGQVPWNKGLKMPEEQRLKQTGEKSSVFGKKQSKDVVKKRIETRKKNDEERLKNGYIPKKRIVTDETRRKQSESMKGKNTGKRTTEYMEKSNKSRVNNRKKKIK